jgi:hypothetical protein
MKQIISIILAVTLITFLSVVGWKVERYVHYKLGYQSLVQAEVEKQVKPLNERISKLEAEVNEYVKH